jgi:tetratricopeptide (TPR) repeat protein
MRTYNKDLKRARRWLASGRNSKVIRFLEPKVPLFLEDPQYYSILGRACLESGLLKDADTYLNRGLQADPDHLEVRLVLAVNHLKRKDPASAVRTWLEILEDDPANLHAKRGLKALKKISDQAEQDKFLDRFDPRRFLPNLSSPWPARILVILTTVLLVLMALYFSDPIMTKLTTGSGRTMRPGAEHLLADGVGLMAENGGNVLYPMDESEVTRTLRRALKHFQNYEDNRARHELNKIKYSNASDEIRQQVLGLLESLGPSTIENIETDYAYQDVISAPWLYEDCFVLWRGRTANVTYEEDSIRFDFLVGFEKGEILEGRVPVVVPFEAVMEPLPLELLARVKTNSGEMTLEAVTLHFLR